MKVDLGEWEAELEGQKEWFDKIGPTLPRPLSLQRELLLERVRTARTVK
jgi:phosphoenolpyruvate carboxykinase (GTP)